MSRPDLIWWEDLVDTPPQRYGPLSISRRMLDDFVRLTGEHHPIHVDDAFAATAGRRERVVPGTLLASAAAGWAAEGHGRIAVVGLRTMSWDFVRPLYPGEPVWLVTTVDHTADVDSGLGTVESTRRITDADDRAYAIGRLSTVVLRRPL